MSQKYDITLSSGLKGAKPRLDDSAKRTRQSSMFFLAYAGQIGYTIAIPLVAGALLGSLAGYTLIGLAIGFIISVIGFVRIIQEVLRMK